MSSVHSFDKHNIVKLLDPAASQVSANSTPIQPFAGGTYGADRATFFLDFGAVGTSLVLTLMQGTTAAFGTNKAITGAEVTVLNAAENGMVSVEIGPGALDDANGYTWVRADVVATGTCVWSSFVILHRLRHAGLTTQDATYRQQIRVYS